MPRQYHDLKCETEYYQAIERGFKKFEFRLNDRNFTPHDMVTLHETVKGIYTGRSTTPFEIQYVLIGGVFGLPEGYCIFNW